MSREQIRFVLLIELAIVLTIGVFAYGFWQLWCGESWSSCVSDGVSGPFSYLLLAAIRPLLFTPIMVLAWIGGDAFGTAWGTVLTALGCLLSSSLLYFPSKILGKKFVKPWLRSNLPSMLKFIRTQDFKIVFLTRWIPIFPFDLMSIAFGVLDFRSKSVAIATLIGIIPEAYVFSRFVADGAMESFVDTTVNLILFASVSMLPLILYEMLHRKHGSSLWMRLKRVYREVLFELHTNNEIVKKQDYTDGGTPVILLYGFFSTRRSLAIIERLLIANGHEVMSFNLGGFFGVFFTKGVRESAEFVDKKIRRQIDRHKFEKVKIVAHSKGGLVALWWLTRLGGYKYCDTVITMGTPYKGTWLTYLALVTPLGLIWKDVWQMRPGSRFLSELHSEKIPDNLNIVCFHSEKDKVCVGGNGIFRPVSPGKAKITGVPMNHISHFEYLFRREVGEALADHLKE